VIVAKVLSKHSALSYQLLLFTEKLGLKFRPSRATFWFIFSAVYVIILFSSKVILRKPDCQI